ncbi:MAG: N-acetyltransferase [Clostridia bacterium]|nr:N-acetyltransferase [Clostridia bacterium]
MHIRPAKIDDLPQILSIYETARRFMRQSGNPTQWGTAYPPQEMLENDIVAQHLYVGVDENDRPRMVFFFHIGVDPTYLHIENGQWPNDRPYGVIHRIATDGTVHGGLTAAKDFCAQFIDEIRMDTHNNNLVMQKALAKNGFLRCGTIYLKNGDPRIAYQWSENKANGTCAGKEN